MAKILEWLRSWRLVSLRTALVVAFALYLVIGFLVVPVVVKKLIVDIARERTGRVVTVEEVRCNPLTLSLTIRGLAMPDRPGSTMLSLDELYANAQLSSLFRWALTLKELRIDNPFAALRRFEDGGVNVLELMDDIEARTPPEENPVEEGGLPRAVLLHILVTGATIDIEDRARVEPLDMTLGPSKFELRDISTIPDKQGVNDFVIGLIGGGTIGVSGDVVVEPLGLDGSVTVDDLSLGLTWPALKPYFQFDLVGGRASGGLDYAVELRDDGLHATVSGLYYEVDDLELTLRDSDTNLLEVARITIDGGNLVWPDARVGASSVVVSGAEAFMWLEPDGTPSWAELVPKETQERVVKTYREVEEAFPWQIDVGLFKIEGSGAWFEDRTFPQPVKLEVSDALLELTDIVTGPGHSWGLSASARLFDDAEAEANGVVATGPMRLETEVDVKNLDLGRFQPYIDRIAPLELRAGVVAAQGTATLDPRGDGPLAGFTGDVFINQIDVRETVVGSEVLKWGRVETRGIDATVEPMAAKIASIDIFEAGIDVVVSEDGRINLIELMAAMAEQSQAAGTSEGTEMPPLRVDRINLHSCSSGYTDRTLTPPFTLALDPVDGAITGVSSTVAAGADLDIEAAVRSGGMMKLEGEMDVLDPKRLTDLAIDIRQASMPPVTPMAVRYIGHPIDAGVIDIGLDYQITNSGLVGNNTFVTNGLELGDKVEGEGMVSLPFKLGVSLLTDTNGLITLEFPIEGNLDDPAFGIGNAIGSAAKEIVGELIKSPFRLLAKLGGGSGDEDLGYVEFRAGSTALEVTATDKLHTLAAGAEQRPELALQVAGAWDAEADALALKHAAFDAMITERLAAEEVPEEERELKASLELLESVGLERLGAEQLQTLRAQHTAASPAPEDAEASAGPVLDETSYYRDLRTALIEAQPIDPAAVAALGAARAEAIHAFLVDESGIDPARIELLEPAVVEDSSGDGWVRCRLDVGVAE